MRVRLCPSHCDLGVFFTKTMLFYAEIKKIIRFNPHKYVSYRLYANYRIWIENKIPYYKLYHIIFRCQEKIFRKMNITY